MRNLKKMAALGAAAVMALSMNVSAFAAATGTATASYSGGKVLLSSLADIDATHQWTVVVIDVADQNANLTADKLYYINQGTSGDTFWTDGMGTKTELKDGDYIVRIGGETIDTTDKLIEIPLKVSTTTEGRTLQLGDVNFADGIGTPDINAILNHMTGLKILEGDALLVADANQADGVGTPDVNAILNHMTGLKLLGTITVK